MSYFLTSNDERVRSRWTDTLEEHGYDVVDEYTSDTLVVTLGGDGTILYAARTYPDPTILPVRAGNSKGYRTQLETDQLLSALEAIETGRDEAYTTVEHRKLAAYDDGTALGGEFDALNEIGLHHSSPTLAAVFAVRVRDRGETVAFEGLVGDGVVVATPFGSTGYYRSITGGQFTHGIGVAFNNVHTPVETPTHVSVSAEATVEIELLGSDHASDAVLTCDNSPTVHDLEVGRPVEIRQSDESIEILRTQIHD